MWFKQMMTWRLVHRRTASATAAILPPSPSDWPRWRCWTRSCPAFGSSRAGSKPRALRPAKISSAAAFFRAGKVRRKPANSEDGRGKPWSLPSRPWA